MVFSVPLESEKILAVALLRDVKNVPEIRRMIIGGSLNCCIIKPCFIVDPFQIAVAANKAIVNEIHEKMATRSIYTEILFNLSLSKNISQSLMKFGIGDNDNDVLVCVVSENAEELDKILLNFQGNVCSIDQLNSLTNEILIKKEYKITEAEAKVSCLLGSVVSRIAAKDFVT